MPDDEVSRLVADDLTPITCAESSDGEVELDHAVVGDQSGNGGSQPRVEAELKLR